MYTRIAEAGALITFTQGYTKKIIFPGSNCLSMAQVFMVGNFRSYLNYCNGSCKK
jgi:hypothetical protein